MSIVSETVNQIHILITAGNFEDALRVIFDLRPRYIDSGWKDKALRNCMFHILNAYEGKGDHDREVRLALRYLDEFKSYKNPM